MNTVREQIKDHIPAKIINEMSRCSISSGGFHREDWVSLVGSLPDPRMHYEIAVYERSNYHPYVKRYLFRALASRDRAVHTVWIMWLPPMPDYPPLPSEPVNEVSNQTQLARSLSEASMQPNEFQFDHPCGLRVSRYLPESQVATVEGVIPRDMGTGYVWYTLPVTILEGDFLAMSLCYHHGRLDSLLIRVSDEDPEPDWSQWSEDKEHAAVSKTTAWFEARGYPLGSYEWGTIWACYDPKSATGQGGIRYKHQSQGEPAKAGIDCVVGIPL